jgi:hypothetical protein
MASDGILKHRSTTVCSGGVVSLLHSPSEGHVRGRERGGEEGGASGREEKRHVACSCVVVYSPSLLGPPLYSGKRGALTPPPRHHQGGGQGGEAAARVGLGRPAPTYPNPNPSRPGLGLRAQGAPSPYAIREWRIGLVGSLREGPI